MDYNDKLHIFQNYGVGLDIMNKLHNCTIHVRQCVYQKTPDKTRWQLVPLEEYCGPVTATDYLNHLIEVYCHASEVFIDTTILGNILVGSNYVNKSGERVNTCFEFTH